MAKKHLKFQVEICEVSLQIYMCLSVGFVLGQYC